MKEPEELEKRIQELKKPKTSGGNGEFMRSLSLIWSIGITFIFSILGSFFLGRKIAELTGIEILFPGFLILGILLGGVLVFKLLKPYL